MGKRASPVNVTNPSPSFRLVGITGGIGTGKSEVSRIFESLGVPVLYADDISKELSVSDPMTRKNIRDLLGDQAYLVDGSLNRTWVAEKIFSQTSLQKKLEAILHPAVFKEIVSQAKALAARRVHLAMVEAALVYESKLEKLLDAVIVVDADERTRIARLQQRDGASAEEIRRRMRAQLAQPRKVARADYVIYNNGSRAELEERVAFLFNLFTHLEKP